MRSDVRAEFLHSSSQESAFHNGAMKERGRRKGDDVVWWVPIVLREHLHYTWKLTRGHDFVSTSCYLSLLSSASCFRECPRIRGESKEKGQVDAKEREARRRKKRLLFRDIRRGPRPYRLFVIVICITMDETRVMGSWDLPSEHDEEVGERNPLCSALCKRHASTFDQCSRYHIVAL